jgi:hypothetical protein
MVCGCFCAQNNLLHAFTSWRRALQLEFPVSVKDEFLPLLSVLLQMIDRSDQFCIDPIDEVEAPAPEQETAAASTVDSSVVASSPPSGSVAVSAAASADARAEVEAVTAASTTGAVAASATVGEAASTTAAVAADTV